MRELDARHGHRLLGPVGAAADVEDELAGQLCLEGFGFDGTFHRQPPIASNAALAVVQERFFAWLFEERARVVLPVMAVPAAGPLDTAWRPPTMATSWRAFGTTAPLEVVRFAAANRLCVELDYRDEEGRRGVRTI